MKTTTFRSVLSSGVIVSTVRLGRSVYETAFVVDGRVSDGEVSTSKDKAALVHDHACDFINYPSSRDMGSPRTERFVRMFGELAAF